MPNFIHKRSYLEDQDITKKRCLTVRYGGIGDAIIFSSILPLLKKEGYHITFNTTVTGYEVLKHNPHIDKFLIQDKGQVPPAMLSDYWKALEQEYDRCINMSESLEGTLLKLPGRRDHALAHEARRMICDVNYLEFAHAMAGVPFEPEQVFYSTDEEKAWAADFRRQHKGAPIILWALGGSAFHKMYPWVDMVTGTLLKETNCKLLFTGSQYEQHLEFQVVQRIVQSDLFLGMDKEEAEKAKLSDLLLKLKDHFGENRILCTCGGWSIRKMLTFAAEQADILVGPETGVMHAAGFLETPKVLFLSHSNANNISRDWPNTTALQATNCPCTPCHMLHTSKETCVEAIGSDGQETGASLCTWNIEPKRVYDSIIYWLKERGLSTSG